MVTVPARKQAGRQELFFTIYFYGSKKISFAAHRFRSVSFGR
jgi:hypothetical protein